MDTTEPAPRSLGRGIAALAPFFSPHRLRLFAIAALAVSAASLAALEPLVLKRLFDGLSASSPLSAAAIALGMLGAILLGGELLQGALDWLTWRVRLALDYALMQATIERLHSLPLAYHREQSVGATMTKIERGIQGCMTAFSDVLVKLVPALIYLLVSIIVMLRLQWQLSLAVMLFAPLPAIVGARAAKEQTAREQSLMARWTKVFSRFNEVLAGIVVVKSFTMEEREKRRFLGGVQSANALVLRGVATDAKNNARKNTLAVLARLCALALGGALVVRHQITLGTLVAFVSYLGGVFHPVQTLTGLYQTLRRATVSLDALLSILEAQDSLGDDPHAYAPAPFRGEIVFDKVSFRYRAGAPLLHDIDLHVQPGELVALVGPSGTGKSTLMALLQRLYDPCNGSIRIDGQDIRGFKQRALRDQIGVVLQDGTLFSDTVADNIAFGSPGASRAQIEAAARAANAHDFIAALPNGYDTLAGERGCKLSGGERQRVAIARALLKDAPILVLDEATSALDADSEEKVQEALVRLVHGRTTFVIAHRLSTIVHADRILVLRGGTIVESGNHDQLMQHGGHYAALVRKQMKAFIAKTIAA
jgi:ABC-type multidrug transport system fused ATPase/permease subunit